MIRILVAHGVNSVLLGHDNHKPNHNNDLRCLSLQPHNLQHVIIHGVTIHALLVKDWDVIIINVLHVDSVRINNHSHSRNNKHKVITVEDVVDLITRVIDFAIGVVYAILNFFIHKKEYNNIKKIEIINIY